MKIPELEITNYLDHFGVEQPFFEYENGVLVYKRKNVDGTIDTLFTKEEFDNFLNLYKNYV